MVNAVFTNEDKKNLQVLAKELPKLRVLIERLTETIEVLGDSKLMKSVRASQKDIRKGRVFSFKELKDQLNID